jgi:hypothetical protein
MALIVASQFPFKRVVGVELSAELARLVRVIVGTAADIQLKAAGIDIPLLAYRQAAGQRPPSFDCFREGIWLWHFVEDLQALDAYR